MLECFLHAEQVLPQWATPFTQGKIWKYQKRSGNWNCRKNAGFWPGREPDPTANVEGWRPPKGWPLWKGSKKVIEKEDIPLFSPFLALPCSWWLQRWDLSEGLWKGSLQNWSWGWCAPWALSAVGEEKKSIVSFRLVWVTHPDSVSKEIKILS